MEVSVVIPSKDCSPIRHVLSSLSAQLEAPREIIIVSKACGDEVCGDFRGCRVLARGDSVTEAMNAGAAEAVGDIVLFLDDDAVAPPWLVKRVTRLFRDLPRSAAAVSGRDLYYDPATNTVRGTEEDRRGLWLWRRVKTVLRPPHPRLREYWCGVYVDKAYNILFGPCLPRYPCRSLLYKAVVLAVRRDVFGAAWFPVHPDLKRYIGFEQVFAARLVAAGHETLYDPSLYVYHIDRPRSLSRRPPREEAEAEARVIRGLLAEVLGS